MRPFCNRSALLHTFVNCSSCFPFSLFSYFKLSLAGKPVWTASVPLQATGTVVCLFGRQVERKTSGVYCSVEMHTCGQQRTGHDLYLYLKSHRDLVESKTNGGCSSFVIHSGTKNGALTKPAWKPRLCNDTEIKGEDSVRRKRVLDILVNQL